MPIAGPFVAKEIAFVCKGNKCPNTAKWLNDLFLFKEQYEQYKSLLSPMD